MVFRKCVFLPLASWFLGFLRLCVYFPPVCELVSCHVPPFAAGLGVLSNASARAALPFSQLPLCSCWSAQHCHTCTPFFNAFEAVLALPEGPARPFAWGMTSMLGSQSEAGLALRRVWTQPELVVDCAVVRGAVAIVSTSTGVGASQWGSTSPQ